MQFSESLAGHPFFTIQVDKIRFEHKKFGFIRFGMLPVAVIEGLKLILFDRGKEKKKAVSQLDSANFSAIKEMEKYFSEPGFLKLFKLDRAYTIRLDDPHISLIKNDKKILSVNCRQMSPDKKKGIVKLSGRVLIVAGDKRIEGELIYFNWKKLRFFSNKKHKFIQNQQTIIRKKLNTDVLLSSL